MTKNRSKGTLGVGLRGDRRDDVLRLLSPHDVVDVSLLQSRIHVQEIGFVLRLQHHLVHTGEFQVRNAYLSKLLQ